MRFHPTFRRLGRIATLLIPAALTGCDSSPPGPPVYQFRTNDYEVEYDGQQKKTTVGVDLVRMVRYPEDIEIVQGTLRVGPRDYGPVARHDRISVLGHQVSVNGQKREAMKPPAASGS